MEKGATNKEQWAKIAKLLDDLRWTHFVILALNKDDGGILTIRRGEDGGIVHPLTEKEDLEAIQGGIRALFKKDPDSWALFLGIMRRTVKEVKGELKWMEMLEGPEGEA